MKRHMSLLPPRGRPGRLGARCGRAGPDAPSGVTAIALDGKVSLAWPAVTGASGYRVYRGTSATSTTTLVGSPTGASFVDTTAANGTTYFYAVSARRRHGRVGQARRRPAQATPLARSCSTGNATVVENCTPAAPGWKLTNAGRAYDNGIEGFATATSVNAAASVDLKVNTGPTGATLRTTSTSTGWATTAARRAASSRPSPA